MNKKRKHTANDILRKMTIGLMIWTSVTAVGVIAYCNQSEDEPTIQETIPEATEAFAAPLMNRIEKIDIPETVAATEAPTAAVTAPVPTETEYVRPYEISTQKPTTDLEMLACVIYCEHGGDNSCDECRMRVGDVVLNRVADPRFPNTIRGVLTAPSQYGRFHWTGVVWPERASSAGERHAVERAYAIANILLNDTDHSSLYNNGYIWQAEFHQGHDEVYCCGTYYGK